MAFRGIQAETTEQGSVHKSIARELQHLVADPFEEWAKGYHVRHSTYSTLHVVQSTTYHRRGSWAVGLLSLMDMLRSMN